MLPMGHCQNLPPLCSLQAETVEIGSQQGFPSGSIGKVITEKDLAVDVFPDSLHSTQIPHLCLQDRGTYKAILSDHSQ